MEKNHLQNFLLLEGMAVWDNTVASMLLEGEPGVGKTYFTKKFAEYWNAKTIFCQCYVGFGKDQFLYDFDPAALVEAVSPRGSLTGKDALRQGYLIQALNHSKKQKTLLVIDEFDKSTTACDAFLLDFLQSCRLTDPILGEIVGVKENLIVLFTSNGNREFEDALSRRWVVNVMKFPEKKEFTNIINNMLGDSINELGKHGEELIKMLCASVIKYRNANPKKKLVQNEVFRIAKFLIHAKKNEIRPHAKEILPMLISPHEKDREIFDSLVGFNYIISRFLG